MAHEHFLPDLLGYVLLASLRSTALHGWPSGYTETFANVRMLKGRIDTGRILTAVLSPGTIPCQFEELSRDIPANRLAKWAAEQLSLLVRSPILARDLMDEGLTMRDVISDAPSPHSADRISLPPTAQSLAPAVRVGQLLLAGRSLRHGLGDESLPGFLWDSSVVYERFTKELVRRCIRRLPHGVRLFDSPVHLGEPVGQAARRLQTTPDIRLVSAASYPGVLDAKYKIWSGSPSAADSYQVVAGGWVSGSHNVGLIYPTPSPGRKIPVGWKLTGAAPPGRLWAIFVDLIRMADPNGETALIEDLANDLKSVGASH